MRAAAEREFTVIGEAVSQLAKVDQELAFPIANFRRIVSFRNLLVHGYGAVDDALVWDVVGTVLPLLRSEVEALLGEA